MSLLPVLSQEICDDKSGVFIVVSRIIHDGGANTLEVPSGLAAQTGQVAFIPDDATATAPTVSAVAQAAFPAAGTITFSGGSSGVFRVITRHTGNPAGLG